ncbi:WYL domain-containing transcriptional regulator [Streptomyces sp. WAC05374]|uniref:helix-turn-helix transcriptional regulator n=1 Tax=Streptomyces sp. WAC05374 TaxID=2487420 RepID=UPI000F8757EE|nr:WYL domain-containing protein [Streptomyces sp. WAC05374]RST17449.1 WYL domain-containing transcriptional regulator [Streptomyces sp. WAC05374]TDF36816.1 WYL domain-containing transcriptional regulator [Streptomyces sp. WAC05374]TDF46308.1 WYL domain-containing transcriptional regulator [Streptomyces sp. WAC05374]TDF46869.1 WYL domain-containing transcriptional regulator [Streptomyces sp. WAC05374]
MASTSRRALRLLSLLGSRRQWPLRELATRLGVSERTVRRDIETLRRLDYPITTVHGPDGGYRLGAGHTLPPLLFDDDQALAVAVALQTAPSTVFGLADDAARALAALEQVMPAPLRAAMGALRLTRLQNYWEFSAPPIDSTALTAVGAAVHRRHVLVTETLRADGSRPEPGDDDFLPARRIEPHHLVVWAGRWYLVAYDLADQEWRVCRVDRLHPRPTTRRFTARELPGGDLAQYVMSSHDRGDTTAAWPCTGSARLRLPAGVVARWAPGGSVVEHLDSEHCRLTLGAWSWAGIAGILATFDAELTDLRPRELVQACRRLAHRWAVIGETGDSDDPAH